MVKVISTSGLDSILFGFDELADGLSYLEERHDDEFSYVYPQPAKIRRVELKGKKVKTTKKSSNTK